MLGAPLARRLPDLDNDFVEPEQRVPTSAEERSTGPEEEGLRFGDPYWDDAFCAWWDPGLRTCC
jgi:hypothetical protein